MAFLGRRSGHLRRVERRRLLWVARHPHRANSADVELLLRSHGLPEADVATVGDAVRRHRLVPTTVWEWVHAHDADALLLLLGLGLPREILVRHLERGDGP